MSISNITFTALGFGFVALALYGLSLIMPATTTELTIWAADKFWTTDSQKEVTVLIGSILFILMFCESAKKD